MRILIFFFLMFISIPAQAQSGLPQNDLSAPDSLFTGLWANELGSQLELFVDNGQVTGTYQTNVGQPDKSKSFKLQGQVDGDQILFLVNFKGFGSMTAWVGQVVEDEVGDGQSKPMIRTMWHNTKDIKDKDERDNVWGSIRTGASNFHRIE